MVEELKMTYATIEEVPILTSSLRIMKFWSFLLAHNWRRYASLTPYILMNFSQFLDIFLSKESIDAIIRNAYIAVLFFNTLMRGVVLSLNRFKNEAYCEDLRVLYLELMHSNDDVVVNMLQKTTKTARLLAKVNLFLGMCSVMGFLIYPAFATTKVLPYGVYVPYVDMYASPCYELLFLSQIILAPVGCCMFIPFTNLVVAFMMFGILMCKVLQYKLKQLMTLPKDKVLGEIVWCIKYQLKLESYVDGMNRLTTYVYLVEFLTSGAMLCGMLFLFIIVETLAQKIIVSIYVFMIFVQSVALYSNANELYDESFQISIAAYETNWYDYDPKIQKMIKLFILRAQKPNAVLVGNVYPMNLQLLQSLLNATYSYFTLLKRVYG